MSDLSDPIVGFVAPSPYTITATHGGAAYCKTFLHPSCYLYQDLQTSKFDQRRKHVALLSRGPCVRQRCCTYGRRRLRQTVSDPLVNFVMRKLNGLAACISDVILILSPGFALQSMSNNVATLSSRDDFPELVTEISNLSQTILEDL